MDQNISVDEVLNNSFATIYDVLKIVDSNVNELVINNLNNNATADEILRLKQFNEDYIKVMQETKCLQNDIVELFNYMNKDITEIKQDEMEQDLTNEVNPEDVNQIDDGMVQEVQPEMVNDMMNDFGPVPETNDIPVENVVETPMDIVNNDEVTAEEIAGENTEEVTAEEIAGENNDEVTAEEIAGENPEEATAEENTVAAEGASLPEITFNGTEDTATNDGAVLPTISVPNPVVPDVPIAEGEAAEAPVQEETSNEAELKVFRTSNDPAKVILVTNPQYEKLKQSLETKKALLNAKGMFSSEANLEDQLVQNGLLEGSVEDKQAQIQQLIAEAQELYKEGKNEEAQEKMNLVSQLNEQIKGETPQENVMAA